MRRRWQQEGLRYFSMAYRSFLLGLSLYIKDDAYPLQVRVSELKHREFICFLPYKRKRGRERRREQIEIQQKLQPIPIYHLV